MRLLRGTPGHPLHPPLTDATIGAYTVAAVLGIVAALGIAEGRAATGWWLALLVGLVLTVPTALTGLVDFLSITMGTPLWRTALSHMIAMVTAAAFFLAALLVGHAGYADGAVGAVPLTLTLVGFAALTVGGWLGGTVVFRYGMRVVGRTDEPALEASVPHTGEPEQPRRAA